MSIQDVSEVLAALDEANSLIATLQHNIEKLEDELGDALDQVEELGAEIEALEETIAELEG